MQRLPRTGAVDNKNALLLDRLQQRSGESGPVRPPRCHARGSFPQLPLLSHSYALPTALLPSGDIWPDRCRCSPRACGTRRRCGRRPQVAALQVWGWLQRHLLLLLLCPAGGADEQLQLLSRGL